MMTYGTWVLRQKQSLQADAGRSSHTMSALIMEENSGRVLERKFAWAKMRLIAQSQYERPSTLAKTWRWQEASRGVSIELTIC